MSKQYIWDDDKRKANIAKHGFDFAKAGEILDSRYRLDVIVVRGGEERTQSFSYALGYLAVLTVVHMERDKATRIISFRCASKDEKEFYHDWLENKFNDA
jgi:uncharacterized protein